MKIITVRIVILLALLISLGSPAFSVSAQPPVGGCPPGFVLHEFGHHMDGDPMHHIGLTQDLNGDGMICVKHISDVLHVHMDNVIR